MLIYHRHEPVMLYLPFGAVTEYPLSEKEMGCSRAEYCIIFCVITVVIYSLRSEIMKLSWPAAVGALEVAGCWV
jgi:hypothetical protein